MAAEIAQGYRPGCIGRIAELHGAHYAACSGFGVAFEARVARELAAFCIDFEPGRDGLFLAVDAGSRIQGSVVLDGSHARDEGAHLRWFILADALRGMGMGRRLLDAALSLADARGYRCVYLWTFAGLDAARHLYEAAGFRLVHESPGTQWGSPVLEQRFERLRN